MNADYVAPADARLAATLLLVRDGAQGVEILMMRRAERDNDFRSGAVVFPGGVLEPADRAAKRFVLGATDADLSRRYGLAQGLLDYAVAAVRETFEEVGLLLACDDIGRPAEPRPVWTEWRQRMQAGQATLAQMCESLDLRLDLRGLACWSHWLTPPGVNKRFDTRFFLAPAPLAQVAATRHGYVLSARDDVKLVVLAPLDETRHGTVLALLADGEAWSSTALAVALGQSARTVQRALEQLAADGRVHPLGRGRARRWVTPSVPGFPTALLLPLPPRRP